ncbi:hypothetical protein SH2C18_14910 [Clostridium sediminicola]|uniref:ATP-binding protein n=1 Tax=Clostridium sediminicola TaxID=3114879 RepID=UPI0031F20B90
MYKNRVCGDKMYKLEELIDSNDIKPLIQDFGDMNNTTIMIIDSEGKILLRSKSSALCEKFHGANKDLSIKCTTDKHLLVCPNKELTKCHFGMGILSVPIKIFGEIIGYIQMGQFFTREADLEYYINKAELYGFNTEEYLEALSQIPIIPIEKLGSYKNFLARASSTIVKGSYKELIVKEQGDIIKSSNQLLEKEINKRTMELIKTSFMYRESREKYRSLIDFLPDVIYVVVDGKIQFANEAAQNFFGVSKITDMIGVHEKEYLKIHHTYEEKIKHVMEKVNKGHDLPFVELKVIRKKDNKAIDVNVGVSKYTYDELNGYLIIIRKFSYKKEAEEFSRLFDEAVSYDKLKTEFFSNISHEFRTPLNVIISALQVLEMYSEGDNINTYIDKNNKYRKIMRQNCYRLLKLVNNLIDITKIDSGYMDVKLENQNIVSLVEEISFTVKDYIESNQLIFSFKKEISERVIACDSEKIERILLNILSNAVKFTPSGGKITVSITEEADNVCIIIKDTGIGIAKEKQEIIFERFRQVDKSFARTNEGSGIGLSLVKSLVEIQNGRIELESELGKGSEYKIFFPIVKDKPLKSTKVNKPFNNNRVEVFNIEFSDIYEKN